MAEIEIDIVDIKIKIDVIDIDDVTPSPQDGGKFYSSPHAHHSSLIIHHLLAYLAKKIAISAKSMLGMFVPIIGCRELLIENEVEN